MKQRVLINGAMGHMGKAILTAMEDGTGDLVPAAGVDLQAGEYPVPLIPVSVQGAPVGKLVQLLEGILPAGDLVLQNPLYVTLDLFHHELTPERRCLLFRKITVVRR